MYIHIYNIPNNIPNSLPKYLPKHFPNNLPKHFRTESSENNGAERCHGASEDAALAHSAPTQ